MRLITLILLLLIPMAALGQGSVRRVDTLSELLRINPNATGTGDRLSYEVVNRSTNVLWSSPRHVVWKPQSSIPTNGWSVFASPFGGRWVFSDRESPVIDVRWLGMVGDGQTDNKSQFVEMISLAATNAAMFTFPAGVYNVSTNLAFRSNYPINLDTASGYATGWNPSDAATEARIVYTGPLTDVFVDFTPATGIRYGLNIRGITFDANTYAGTAVMIKRNTRGNVEQMRARNGFERVAVIELSQYINFNNLTVSSAEIPFLVTNRIGVSLTNQANLNTFNGMVVNGASEFGVDISDNSKANTIICLGSEGNSGGALRIRSSANQNTINGMWMEQNWLTNRIIQIDSGALNNRIINAYSENREGNVYVDGAYNLISESSFGGLEFGVSGGHNVAQNVILGIGVLPTGPIYNQTLLNVIDATASSRTNTFQDPVAFYGGTIDLVSESNQYPTARLSLGSLLFGDGTTSFPNVGWTRFSASSLATSNTVLMMRSGAHDGVYNVYVSGDAYPRVSLNSDTTYATGPGGPTPADTSFYRMASRTWLSSGSWLIQRPSTSSSAIASYIDGDPQPMWYVRGNGSTEFGPGGSSSLDTTLYRHSAGYLGINYGLYIGSTNVAAALAAASTNGHTHDGRYVLSTNGFSTNLTATGTTTINGTLIATNIGSDLASAGAHRIIVREASTMNLRPMTASYLKGLLDIHVSDISDAGSLGRSIVTNASIAGLMPLIGSGTPNSSVWLRGDGTWSTPPTSGAATNGILDVPIDDVMYGRINGGWVGLDMQYITGVSTYFRSLMEAEDEASLLGSINLTGLTPATIDSPAVHVTRINSGGAESSRHRLNLIAGSGISLALTDDAVDDEADLTVSTSLADSSVTLAKIENVTAGKLLGRTSASAGPPQEITPGAGLLMSGTTLSVDQSSFTSGQILYASASDVSLNGASFTQGAWTNILGSAKSGTSLTIPANTLTSGSTLEIKLAGTMAFDDGTDNNKVRVTVGGLTFTFTFEEVEGFASLAAPWDITCMVTVKTSGTSLLSVIKSTGWWNWTTIEGFTSPAQSSYYGYRTRPVISGSLDTTAPLTISAEFFGDNSTSENSAQFTEFDCNHVIATRY